MKRIVSMVYVVFFPPDDHSEWEPPDPLSNSEVKPLSADGSVGSPHARVGHRQAFIQKKPGYREIIGLFRMHGKTPLFICGAALRAVRPLASSRRSSPLAALPQKLGVTHPHASDLAV